MSTFEQIEELTKKLTTLQDELTLSKKLHSETSAKYEIMMASANMAKGNQVMSSAADG